MATETKKTTKKAKAEPEQEAPETVLEQETPEAPTEEQEAPEKVEYMVNVARGLNMRAKPKGKVLRVLPVGHIVTGEAYEEMPEWVEVQDGEQTGWVMSEYLNKAEGGEADA